MSLGNCGVTAVLSKFNTLYSWTLVVRKFMYDYHVHYLSFNQNE